MLKSSDALDGFYQQFEAFRAGLQDEVAKLAAEIEKTGRRNQSAIAASCATIEAAVRDYQVFMTRVNAVRIQEEAQAESTEDLLEKRREWGAATARTNLFRGELNRWHDVKDLVHTQSKVRRQKLYSDDSKLPATTAAQLLASDDVFNWLHAIFNPSPQTEEAREYGCFPDIGLSNADFHAHLHAAYRVCLARRQAAPIRFLDVGCGAGLKVYSALRYFDEAQGLDLDPAYIEAGKRFLAMDQKANAKVFEQDALSFDGYDAFDVIYFYRPMSDDRMLVELEKSIADAARPGTVLVAPYVGFSERHADLGCGKVAGSVYLADTSQKEADAWRRKAERTGHFIIKEQPSVPRTIWSPLFDVSRANGYDTPSGYRKPKY